MIKSEADNLSSGQFLSSKISEDEHVYIDLQNTTLTLDRSLDAYQQALLSCDILFALYDFSSHEVISRIAVDVFQGKTDQKRNQGFSDKLDFGPNWNSTKYPALLQSLGIAVDVDAHAHAHVFSGSMTGIDDKNLSEIYVLPKETTDSPDKSDGILIIGRSHGVAKEKQVRNSVPHFFALEIQKSHQEAFCSLLDVIPFFIVRKITKLILGIDVDYNEKEAGEVRALIKYSPGLAPVPDEQYFFDGRGITETELAELGAYEDCVRDYIKGGGQVEVLGLGSFRFSSNASLPTLYDGKQDLKISELHLYGKNRVLVVLENSKFVLSRSNLSISLTRDGQGPGFTLSSLRKTTAPTEIFNESRMDIKGLIEVQRLTHYYYGNQLPVTVKTATFFDANDPILYKMKNATLLGDFNIPDNSYLTTDADGQVVIIPPVNKMRMQIKKGRFLLPAVMTYIFVKGIKVSNDGQVLVYDQQSKTYTLNKDEKVLQPVSN